MEFILANWEYILVGFYTLEKVVKLSPCKWDDVLIDGLKVGLEAAKKSYIEKYVAKEDNK